MKINQVLDIIVKNRRIKAYSILASSLLVFCALLSILVTQPVLTTNTNKHNGLASAINLEQYVKTLSTALPERSDDVDKLNVSAKYIFEIFNKYSSIVSYQDYDVWGIPYRNVVARFGPTGIDDRKEVIVIGAHYDSFQGYPGADDNASGVAGLLELARLFTMNQPSTAIDLVAYSLEEPPYFYSKDMGSYRHAQSLYNAGIHVKLMISLEMIGYFSNAENSQRYPMMGMGLLYPNKGNFIAIVGRFNEIPDSRFFKTAMRKASPLPVYSMNAIPLFPGVNLSDHFSYWRFDFPAIMITDTAFFRNGNYHTEYDTWEKLNYEKMGQVVDAVYTAVLDFSKEN